MNRVLNNRVRILSRSCGQKIRGLKDRQHRPSLIVADGVEDLDWVRCQQNRDKSDRVDARRHPDGDAISTRCFKQAMLISECNGRISELQAKGHIIQTSS